MTSTVIRRAHRFAGVALAAAAGLAVLLDSTTPASAQLSSRVERGTLSSDDEQLDGGEYFDVHTFEGVGGQLVTVDLRSSDFDTFLLMYGTDEKGEVNPDQNWVNDDFESDQSHSRLEVELPADGSYAVVVTSYGAKETGAYELTMTTTTPAARVESGALGADDQRLESGEFFDIYKLRAAAGESYVLDLYSEEFDTYLFVRCPEDESFMMDNDDHDGSVDRSRIVMEATVDGVYLIYVTSYQAGETGAYRLTISDAIAGSGGEPAERREQGELARGDDQLDGGEYFDQYTFTAREGESLVVDLTSDDFDTYLVVLSSVDDQFQLVNDDHDGSTSHSRIEMTAPADGDYEVLVTSYEAGETGRYELTISGSAAAATDSGIREERGELAKGDEQLDGGEYVDHYEFRAEAGAAYVIDLYSDEFDTYLFLRSPDDDSVQLDNDDFDGQTNRSQIRFEARESGTYAVFVTSYAAAETGAYRLTIQREGAAGAGGADELPDAAAQGGTRRETGRLESGDETLTSGEYRDVFEFQGRPGQHARITLTSDEFDPYLILQDPRGDTQENDDYNGRRDTSVIDTELTELGTYRIAVTTYRPGETGAYELVIDLSRPGPGAPGQDVVELDSDGTRPGSLDEDDSRRDGKYVDLYSFSGVAGQRVVIRMTSDEFDPLLVLTYPDGTRIEFDDDRESVNAAIDIVPEQSGRYRVAATSYNRGVTGDYMLDVRLNASSGSPDETLPPGVSLAGGRRLLGVFVGISDYPGSENDLDYCDQDAQLLYDILQREFNMQAADSVLLLNGQATVARITQAIERIGRRAGPEDLLLFFYSGHGDQSRTGVEDASDPDGIHETLSVHDGEILDDEFARLINDSPAGICLVAIDACFSGGFAKDVVSARGRMGMFSSEEDVLSVVPEKFRAGGYLSRFLAEAVSERRHESDRNGDRALTAHELSHYLQERYLQEVRSTKLILKGGEGYVSPDEDLSFQRLVVDRGGLSHDQILFRWD